MKKSIILTCTLLIFFAGCQKKNRFVLEEKNEEKKISIHRFDLDFMKVQKKNSLVSVKNLYKQYPDFFPVFVHQILSSNYADTLAIAKMIADFNSDSNFSKVNLRVKDVFREVGGIEEEISQAYNFISHYFPEIKLPEIYFFVSGFNRPVILSDNFIAFGSDYYLGNDFPLYKGFSYEYMLYNMRKEAITVDIISTILFKSFQINTKQDRLIDNMIFRGKIMYIVSCALPKQQEENIMGYTQEQMKWCYKHEKQIWGTMIDQKDIFSSNALLIKKYLNDAPFTGPISNESPGRLGTWVGWKIVESFVKNNNQITLKELLNTESQELLEKSGYTP